MIKFIRRNEKQLMALFAVFLMISFVATLGPSKCSNMNVGQQGDYAIGHIGSTPVMRNEVNQAASEWEFLRRYVLAHVTQGPGDPGEWQPLVLANTGIQFFQVFATQIDRNPEVYYLLLHEARQMGLTPQYDLVERQFLSNPQVAILLEDNRRVSWADVPDENRKAMARQSLADFLMITSAFERATGAIKVSEPLARYDAALMTQQIKARVVDFPARDFEAQLTAPTDEQLKKLFDQFADIEAGRPVAQTNPFGFGYRYPNRLKLQYIEIPRAEVRKTVQSARSDYEWDVEASKYYQLHQSEFPTTQPATTQEALSLGPATRAAPTTRPFVEVREQIINLLIEPRVDQRQVQIQSDLNTRLAADYDNWKKAHPGGPTTVPAGSSEFEDFAYVQKVAQDFQNRYKVTLTVASIADGFKTASELQSLPGIGQVSSFGVGVIASAEPLASAENKGVPGLLSLFQPSKAIADASRNLFIFRITAADPAHKPNDLAEVREQVERDWKRQQAFSLAKTEAQKLLDAARGPGLESAADGKKVVTTGEFMLNPSTNLEPYHLTGPAVIDFLRCVRGLTSTLSQPDHPRPISLVELTADEKVAVVEIISAQSMLTPQNVKYAQAQLSAEALQQFRSQTTMEWFGLDSVMERTGYQDDTGRSRRTAKAAVAQ
jgi:hypothetical protein